MRHGRFLGRLLNRPQLIAPAAGAAVLAALAPSAALMGYDGERENEARSPREYSQAGGIAIIPVLGELVHRGGSMDAMSGVTSYQALADMVGAALADRHVDGIMLDIDSPGGESGGCLDFAEWLASQRGVKPIYASVNQLMCSAAYAIGSAADRIVIGADAQAGSIGVVMYHADVSEALQEAGVKVTFIQAGRKKTWGASELPLDPDAAQEFQGEVDAIYRRFVRLVAANRGITEAAVRQTEAGIYRGQDAIDAGLADQIATFEEAVMALATHTAPRGASLSAGRMGKPKTADKPETQGAPEGVEPEAQPETQPDGTPPGAWLNPQPVVTPKGTQQAAADMLAVMEACHAAGFASLITPLVRSGASMAAVKERLTLAAQIKETAARCGMPEVADEFIAEGVSLEFARKQMARQGAAIDDAVQTDTRHTGASATAPTIIDAGAIYAKRNSQKKAI
ncbi:S49 family peptidase [Falsiroseomonas tokyonensis]|uniref:S49 family peptidase n=1 Tax=Falsiroseomonas tokyonensis TaxID=430521 RepID=A0ABV7C2Y7_9PROT|nr:S49 family peptidase [Falsiroseomonas tokyonensis]MBU8540822.1 S49 family peptidase [Falsiroseomonas tokyonensis]